MNIIKTEEEYEAIYKRVDELLEVVSDETTRDSQNFIELDVLSQLIANYEEEYYPISTPSLIDVIKLRMHEMGLTQAKLAEILGVSPSRISEYLAGKEPTLKIAKAMCEKLDISASIVLGVNPNRNRQSEPYKEAV